MNSSAVLLVDHLKTVAYSLNCTRLVIFEFISKLAFVIPKIGNPSLKISGSYVGASTSYTELGPPEMIMALNPWSLMC